MKLVRAHTPCAAAAAHIHTRTYRCASGWGTRACVAHVLENMQGIARQIEKMCCLSNMPDDPLYVCMCVYLYRSFDTTLCVRYSNEEIACGCVYLAARRLGMALPEAPPWWYLFDVTEQKLMQVAKEIQGLYALPKPEYMRLAAAPLDDHTINTSATAPKVEDNSNKEEVRGAAIDGGEERPPRTKRRGWDR